MAVELSRVSGSAPQLITIGADKTLAIWDTMTFKVNVMSHLWIFHNLPNSFFNVHVYFFSTGTA